MKNLKVFVDKWVDIVYNDIVVERHTIILWSQRTLNGGKLWLTN